MKTAFLLFTILVALATLKANAGLPPTTLKGQGQASKITTFNFETANQLATKTSTGTLIESGNNNILHNPSFEQATLNAGVTTWNHGALAPVLEESSTVIHGKKVLVFNASSQAILLTQSSTLYAGSFADGVQCLAQIRVKTDHTVAVNICSIQNSVTSTTNCVTVSADSKWGLYKVPFICGGTNNGISIVGASGTGTTYIDDAFVGAQDLKQDVNTILVQASHINRSGATFAIDSKVLGALTTNTANGVFSYNSATGDYTLLRKAKLDISLSVIGTAQPLPVISILSGGLSDQGVSTSVTGGWSTTSATGVYDVGTVFNGRAASATTTNQRMSVTATEVINTSIYSASCGANCVDTFSAKVSSADVVSNENVDFINGNCDNATTGVATCVWKTGIFTVAPNCTASNRAGGVWTELQIESSSTEANIYTYNGSSVPVNAPFTISCQKQGADFTATRTIVGSFKDIPTTLGTDGSDIQSVYFGAGTGCATVCSTGTCIICGQVGNKITSVTWTGAGTYRLNGINANKYFCGGVGYGSTWQTIAHDRTIPLASYAAINTPANTQSATVTCIGTP